MIFCHPIIPVLVYDPSPTAPLTRKGYPTNTVNLIPSDPLSPTRKNKVSPDVKPMVPPIVIDNNGEEVELDYDFNN